MIIKGIQEEDFINYKKPSMFISFSSCTWKCEKECGRKVCQNGTLASRQKEGYSMEDRKNIRQLTQREKDFATEKHHLITDFLKRSKLDVEELYDVVVFDFLLSVEIYLNSEDLQKKCNFEAFSYMYMKRAIYRH